MANDNVGHVKCPITGDFAVVRRDCRGKLYYYSQAGKIAPNLPQGQDWINEQSVLWPNPNQPPENVTLTVVVQGAPLTVVVNPVNEQVRTDAPQGESEIPLTPKPVKKTQSALSYLLNGGG